MHSEKRLATLDVESIRDEFPIFKREVRPGIPLIYLDSAATSQKPIQVIQAITDYYQNHNANIHRGIHTLAEEATALYEESRKKIADFINAPSSSQIVFTRNTTESINLVAETWGWANLNPGDRVLLTEMEHHSNLVPWQMLAEEKELELDFIPVTPEGVLDLDVYHKLLNQNPKLVAFTHMSNVLGTINPARDLIRLAHQAGSITLVDGAQAVPHIPVNVESLGVDFYAFSGHKMCGPDGIGALFGRRELLESMPPYMGGGDMIKSVALRSFRANDLPHKFEAGTPAIADVIGFGAAVDYLSKIGMESIAAHETEMISYVLERLQEVPGLKVFGPDASQKGAVASFVLEEAHAHDVAQILDFDGVAVRAGHHCAQPLHEKFSVPATTRASFYLYNSVDDVDHLINGINRVKDTFC